MFFGEAGGGKISNRSRNGGYRKALAFRDVRGAKFVGV
jgi:hypothetical protein